MYEGGDSKVFEGGQKLARRRQLRQHGAENVMELEPVDSPRLPQIGPLYGTAPKSIEQYIETHEFRVAFLFFTFGFWNFASGSSRELGISRPGGPKRFI